jgi:hypothetical protein
MEVASVLAQKSIEVAMILSEERIWRKSFLRSRGATGLCAFALHQRSAAGLILSPSLRNVEEHKLFAAHERASGD